MGDPMTPTDYPNRVRALVADTEPRPPLLPDGTVPTDSDGNCTTCGWKTAAYVPDGPDHVAGCPANQEHWRLGGARSALRYEAPTLARAYLDACEEVERLTRVLRVEQGDDSAGNPPRGWSHSLDLTDEAGAVIRHVWTGPPGEVYGSPYEGWWFTKVRGLYRENQPFHETALEAMEAADRAAGGAA